MLETGERRRPVERLGDAGELAQILLAYRATIRATWRASDVSMPGWRVRMIRASRSTSGKST